MKSLFLALAGGIFVLFSIWWFTPKLHYNIHTVISKEVYRSAQLPKKELEKIVKDKKIRSIINLRNSHPKEKWYREEEILSKAKGIHLYDVSLPAFNFPTQAQLINLTTLLKKAKRPILIHCRHGSDRTGLASAITLILKNDHSITNIEKQASWRYLALNTNSVGKLVLKKYSKWLQDHHQISSAQNFYFWLKNYYNK